MIDDHRQFRPVIYGCIIIVVLVIIMIIITEINSQEKYTPKTTAPTATWPTWAGYCCCFLGCLVSSLTFLEGNRARMAVLLLFLMIAAFGADDGEDDRHVDDESGTALPVRLCLRHSSAQILQLLFQCFAVATLPSQSFT